MFELVVGGGEQPQSMNELTLEELFEAANSLGRLETGAALGCRFSAELIIQGVGNDRIRVVSKDLMLRGNLIRVIEKALKIKEFYRVNNF